MKDFQRILNDYKNVQSKLSIQVSVLPTIFRDEQIDLMVNAGFDTIELNEYQYGKLGETVYEKIVEVFTEYGFKIKYLLWRDWLKTCGITRALEYDYAKHGSFVCVSAIDEPTYAEMDGLKEIFDRLEERLPNGMYVSSNLFPCYANEWQIGDDYEKYVDRYFTLIVANQKTKKSASCDYYPFMQTKDGDSYMVPTWAYNHMLFAKYAKKYDAVLDWCIQSCNYDHHRVVDAQDIKMQMYMCLAFGVTGISFFTYATPLLNCDFVNGGGGMIGQNFQPTSMYYAGKEAIAEFRKLEKFYMDFKWQGAKSFIGANNVAGERKDFTLLTDELTAFAKIEDVQCEEDTIVSELYDAVHGRYGYVVVNYNDPIYGKADTVKFKVKGGGACVVFLKGDPTAFDGEVEFTLERGGGALILMGN